LEENNDHLLDVDSLDREGSFEVPLLLKNGTVSRILVTRTDVLHSFGVPALGVKLDAAPGRLNATSIEVSSLGLFVGSCFELCGRGHRIMPINVLRV